MAFEQNERMNARETKHPEEKCVLGYGAEVCFATPYEVYCYVHVCVCRLI